MRTIISYLVPSYNHELYLPQLLESICLDIAQLEVSAEVVIVDDGSIDKSQSIIKSWVDMNHAKFNIIYLFQQKNQGLPVSLNWMIEHARGEYLRHCASDDILIAGSTQMLYNHIKSEPNLLCALADARIINETGDVIHESAIAFHGGRVKRLKRPAHLVKELIQHWCVAGPSHLTKKSHYEHRRYDEFSRIDDYDLFLSLLEIPNAISFTEEVVCLYRIHTTNISKSKDRAWRIDNLTFFLAIVNRYIKRGTLAKYLFLVKYRTTAKIYYLQKKYIRCFFSLCKSLLS